MHKRNKTFNKSVARLLSKYRSNNNLLENKNREVLKIKENAENGRVLIVYGGRDCDGSQSDGHTKLVDAGYYSAQKFINSLYEGADGAVWYEFAKPSEDADIAVETRDLALEAFENGHNSTIYA